MMQLDFVKTGDPSLDLLVASTCARNIVDWRYPPLQTDVSSEWQLMVGS